MVDADRVLDGLRARAGGRLSQRCATAAERLTTIVGGSRDPLEICLDIAANGGEDTQIRLQACAIALPFLYPRLSATQVDARHTTVNVDAGQLLDRLDERIAKLQ